MVTHNVFLDVFLVECLDALLEHLGILDVAHAVVQVCLEPPHHCLHIAHLQPHHPTSRIYNAHAAHISMQFPANIFDGIQTLDPSDW